MNAFILVLGLVGLMFIGVSMIMAYRAGYRAGRHDESLQRIQTSLDRLNGRPPVIVQPRSPLAPTQRPRANRPRRAGGLWGVFK